jgi:hypothetical protein
MLRMSKSAGYPEGLVLHNGDRNMQTAPWIWNTAL